MHKLALLVLVALTATASAQSDRQQVSTAVLRGRVVNALDTSAVRSADIRLYYIDSGVVVKTRGGEDSLDVFIDSTRSRFGASDSTGAFVVRRLEQGRYMLQVRRIGFSPIEGAIVVDTADLQTTLRMTPTSQLLAKMQITETAVNYVTRRLDRVGFSDRKKFSGTGTFITREEILRRKPLMVSDLLRAYGIYEATVVLDRMVATEDDIKMYPADLVIGVEIYRHNRPTEFNATRASEEGAFAQPKAGGRPPMPNKPYVLVWTYIP